VLHTVDFVIKLGILDLEVGLLNQVGDLFELIEGIIWVVKHNSVKNFCQV